MDIYELDLYKCVDAIKAYCKMIDDCRVCPFFGDKGCEFMADAPEVWNIEEGVEDYE